MKVPADPGSRSDGDGVARKPDVPADHAVEHEDRGREGEEGLAAHGWHRHVREHVVARRLLVKRHRRATRLAVRCDGMRDAEAGRTSLGELARLFLRLGSTAFGGPAAHVAMMQVEVVTRRRWLSVEAGANYSTLSEETLRRLLAEGKLTAHRPVPGRVLIDREELDDFLAASANAPAKNSRAKLI